MMGDDQMKTIMNSAKFRKELVKIMPGYSWTVHRHKTAPVYMSATGIQTSGFNRLSTLFVSRSERNNRIEYEVRSAGFGAKAPWLSEYMDSTLARALRGLQDHYENMAQNYSRHASDLKDARKGCANEDPGNGVDKPNDSKDRVKCWLCNGTDPKPETEIEVECETPAGKHCDPKVVPVHYGCYMDIEP